MIPLIRARSLTKRELKGPEFLRVAQESTHTGRTGGRALLLPGDYAVDELYDGPPVDS